MRASVHGGRAESNEAMRLAARGSVALGNYLI
jgi:hypothetical protein